MSIWEDVKFFRATRVLLVYVRKHECLVLRLLFEVYKKMSSSLELKRTGTFGYVTNDCVTNNAWYALWKKGRTQ